jgi:hypothetical protein
VWQEKTTNQRKFQQTRYCRMSISKKLPAVLIAVVGISFSFVGTTLAQTILVDNKTLGPQEDLEFTPPNMNNTTLCFQTTDNLRGMLVVLYISGGSMSSGYEPKFENFDVSPQEKCISKGFSTLPVTVINVASPDHPFLSKSIRVRATHP